jgi:predicted RecB family nuclease
MADTSRRGFLAALGGMGKALRQTEQAVADKQHPAIFEATFTHDNILARVDILERLPRNKWRLFEVKSSTKLKDYHLYDVAIQRLILEGLGMKVIPCLPDMSYDGMEVAEGNEAGLAWEKMVHAEAGSDERKKHRDDLLAYCKQGTLAMAKLLEVLYEHTHHRSGRAVNMNPSCLP